MHELLTPQPERGPIHNPRMCFRLTWNGEWRAGASQYKAAASDAERCATFLRAACQAPLLLISGQRNAGHLASIQLQLHLFSNPLNILRPLAMGRARAPAINPIGIAPLIDQETLPGELNHLVRDRAAQLLASPAV